MFIGSKNYLKTWPSCLQKTQDTYSNKISMQSTNGKVFTGYQKLKERFLLKIQAFRPKTL